MNYLGNILSRGKQNSPSGKLLNRQITSTLLLRAVNRNEARSYSLSLSLPASVLSCSTFDFRLFSFFFFEGALPSADPSVPARFSEGLRGRFFFSRFRPGAQGCSSLSLFLFLFPRPGSPPGLSPVPPGHNSPSPPSSCSSSCFFSCRALACCCSRSSRTRARSCASGPCSSSPPYLQQPRQNPPQAPAQPHRPLQAQHGRGGTRAGHISRRQAGPSVTY